MTMTTTPTTEDSGAFLPKLRARLAERIREQNAAQRELDALLANPQRFNRDLNPTEARKFAETRDKITGIREERAAIEERIADLEAIQARQQEAAAKHTGVGRVTAEPRLYSEHAEQRDGLSFFRDMVNAELGDYGAKERLMRHSQEVRVESRAIGTSAVAGIVPPTYLTDLVAELARAGRPAANVCRNWELPATGMTVNISRVTTGSSAASQATENASVSSTDMDDTLLTVNVNTIAGQQVVSRQALERGVGVDSLVFADLMLAYNTELSRQVINGSGSSGQHLGIIGTSGINAVTYTDVSPTVAELWSKIADAANQVAVGIYRPADTIIMHPRRWAWITASLDTTGRPVVDTSGSGANSMGAAGSVNNGLGPVGYLQGMEVVLDASMPTNLGAGTNEDRIIVCNRSELHLWEAPGTQPLTIRAEQVTAASLGVTLVVYGFTAFSAGRRPTAASVISSTGLVTPTF